MDGVSRKTRVGVGLQLKALTGERIDQTIRLDTPASNNKSEYEPILVGINLTISVSLEKIIIQSESQLVVKQVNGEYETQDQRMAKYVCLVKLIVESFAVWKLKNISRGSNEKADALAVVAISLPTKETILFPVYYQPESSITSYRVSDIEEACSFWMTPVARYLSLV